MAVLAAAVVCGGVAAPVNGSGPLVWKGTVDRVVDGDTVEIDIVGDGKSAVHVRNSGIQAMETGDCGASAAKKALAELLRPGTSVVLRAKYADSTSFDGTRVRPLRYVDRTSGLDVQLELLKRGLVLAYPLGSRELARQDKYHLIAQQAAQQRIGLFDTDSCGRGPQQDAQLRVWVNWDADGTNNLNGEYVRILNEGKTAVDISGWWVRSATNARYTFAKGTKVEPNRHLTLHSGSGRNTSTHRYWGGTHSRFHNVKPDGVHASGGYLFDPDGDLRSWSMYPCTWGCWEPLSTRSNVSWTATYDPPGNERLDPNLETVNLRNTSTRRIDASYRVVTLKGRVLEFGPGTYVDPGETLRVHMGRGSEKRLRKYLGSDTAKLNNTDGSVVLRNAEGVQIGCARWGNGGPEQYRCTPTVARNIERAELTTERSGRALRLRVVPAGGAFDFVVQRWAADQGWTRFSAGTTATSGTAVLDAPAGRYRVLVPAQLGYKAATSTVVDLVRRPTVVAAGGPSSLSLTVQPDPSPAGWSIRVQRRIAGAWQPVVSTTTDLTGKVTVPLPAGTYRAVVAAAGEYAQAASSAVRVGQVQLGATLVDPAGSVGKIKVNVEPNRVRDRSWSFRLQRRAGGSWVQVGTYQTRGAEEKRTFRYLPSGEYRVQVPAQHGARAGISPTLKYTAPRAKMSLGVAWRSRLRVNAGPALRGAADFRVTIQRRSGKRWVDYQKVTTAGRSERVVVNVPRGTYRVRLSNQHGYRGVVSPKRYVAR